ncbi:MAG: alpha/beta fold hydrolase [Acidobacteriota bacterium]
MNIAGHFHTVVPRLRYAFSPVPEPPSAEWALEIADSKLGTVRLSGRLSRCEAAGDRLLLLVHGLGGCSESPYMTRAARAALAAGFDVLRINLRGSDRRGEDYYHAGLGEDLRRVLACQDLAAYDHLYVLGYSIGGHVSLRMATEACDPRLHSVAAVCAPLDLAPCARHIDRASRVVYRTYLLNGLRSIYAAVAERREVPIDPAEARKIRFLREWDDRVVAPRHGFAGADDYYARASVGPRLGDLTVPALLVLSEDDPMIPATALEERLADRPAALTVRRVAIGGHLGFPKAVNLGLGHLPAESSTGGGPEVIEEQILGWLATV